MKKVKSPTEKAGQPRPLLLPNLHRMVKSRHSHEAGKMKMIPAAYVHARQKPQGLVCAPTWQKSQLNKLQVESTTVSDETFLALIPFIISGTISSEVCAKRLSPFNDVHRRESQESVCYLLGRLWDQSALPSSSQNGLFVQCPSHPVCPDPWSQSVSHAFGMLHLFILKNAKFLLQAPLYCVH